MKRKKWWIIGIIVLAIGFAIPRLPSLIRCTAITYWAYRRAVVMNHVRNHSDTMALIAQSVADTGQESTYRGWDVQWREDDQIVTFEVAYTGIVPASVERGVFCTAELPQQLMGLTYDRESNFDFAYIYEGNGNWMKLFPITANWYWYEFYW